MRESTQSVGDDDLVADAVEVFRLHAIEIDQLQTRHAATHDAQQRRAVAVEAIVGDFETTMAEAMRVLNDASSGMSTNAELVRYAMEYRLFE